MMKAWAHHVQQILKIAEYHNIALLRKTITRLRMPRINNLIKNEAIVILIISRVKEVVLSIRRICLALHQINLLPLKGINNTIVIIKMKR